MVDITFKSNTKRTAIAQAVVKVSHQKTIDTIVNKQVPKGDVFEMAKTAGLFAVKRTSDIIPDCHPLPIEFTAVRFVIDELSIKIEVEVKTVYKTGVEVEAMHGASVVALTMYDMLKPIDKGIEIQNIKLLEKKGGKSDFVKTEKFSHIKTSIIVCSDSVSAGTKEDKSGKAIQNKLIKFGITANELQVVPDDINKIQSQINAALNNGAQLILLTGGTGLSPRDVTPEAVKPLLDREIPGVVETARNYGQSRMPLAMLSRGVAGIIGKTIVITLPGSVNGATESIDAIFPAVLHLYDMMEAKQH